MSGGDSFEDFQAAAFGRPLYGRQDSRSAPASPTSRRRHQTGPDLRDVLARVQERSRGSPERPWDNVPWGGSSRGLQAGFPSQQQRRHSHNIQSNEEVTDEMLQRLRMFSSSEKGGVVNRGDSFKFKISGSGPGSSYTSSVASVASVASDEPTYTVLIMGPEGVGKSSLIQQFTTSEDMCGQEASEDESGCAVPVMLDDKESILVFEELSSGEPLPTRGYDAYVLLYCIDSRQSYEAAVVSLKELRHSQSSAAVILAANKADMERHRKVKQEDAKHIATKYDCKYTEVSTALNMKVDDLLAGILKQIRLTAQRQRRRQKKKEKKEEHHGHVSGLVKKIFRGSHSDISKSVDDLMVL